MTDRELLELAAKAVGIKHNPSLSAACRGERIWWNPLAEGNTMTTIKLPKPDTHCFDDDSSPPKDVWSYSPELVRQIIELDRAQRGEPVLWRYRDSEQCIKPMSGYTPGEGWTPLYSAPQPEDTK